MRFRREKTSSKRAVVKEEESASGRSSSSGGGLMSVTTGIAAPRSIEAPTPVQHKPRQQPLHKPVISSPQRSFRKTPRARPAPSCDDEMLMNAFDNHDGNTSVKPQQSRATKTHTRASGTTQQSKAALYQSHVTVLTDLKEATAKVQQQIAAWQEQAVVCGRKALKAKKEDPKTKKIIITSECKLQLLRRKLLKLNISNAERQLIQLERTQHELEVAIRKLQPPQQPTPNKPKKQSAAPLESTPTDDSDDILLPLEKELENVDVVQEILSTDLKANLMHDDVSEVEYNEEELLEELRTLAMSDNINDRSASTVMAKPRSNRQIQHHGGSTTAANREQTNDQRAPSPSKTKKTASKGNKPDSSFKPTLF